MKKLIKNWRFLSLAFGLLILCGQSISAGQVTGNLRLWHPVTVTFDGPNVDESETTFRNYRLDVTFTKGTKSYKVPGFFAADGNAAETSATTGNKWRAIFTPDETGVWNYSVSFRQGADIAISSVATAGTAVANVDGDKGTFTVVNNTANEAGFFSKGMLKYVNEHYGQFAGNKEWHVKAGPGSPEDFFGYKDFDNTTDWNIRTSKTQVADIYLRDLNGEGLHFYTPHLKDWKIGDPSWKGGKGKAIVGALNYLQSIGCNAIYMIPFTIDDDSDNTWPWTSRDKQMSYDVSKLAQWDIVFTHMDNIGISPNYYLCESANSKFLDGGSMILKYPIYYREVIARFGYHLGMRFNLGEESNMSKEQQAAAGKLLNQLDPYSKILAFHSKAPIEIHTPLFEYLLGNKDLTGPNYQLHPNGNDHLDIIKWRNKSVTAGHKWIVANDESWGVNSDEKGFGKVKEYTWRTFMAGAEGFVMYTAYGVPAEGDITMENFRLVEANLKIVTNCKNLFIKPEINKYLPQISNQNALVGNPTGNDAPFCLAKKDELYIVYRTSTTNQKPLNLVGTTGTFNVKWYNAYAGGALQTGTIATVKGGGSVQLGNPPSDVNGGWAIVLIKEAAPCTSEKTITLSTAGYAGSSVAGGGKYCVGTTASVVATEASDAIFLNWTANGTVVSTDLVYSFSVTVDRALVANFKKSDVTRFTITATSASTSAGSVTGSGTYNQNQSVTVTATAEPCFIFTNWKEGSSIVSTDANYTFTATKVSALVANFVIKTIKVIIEPAASGTVSDADYVCGDEFISDATPAKGFKFDGWFDNNDVLIQTNSHLELNIENAAPIKAKFSVLAAQAEVTINKAIIYIDDKIDALNVDFVNSDSKRTIKIYNSLGGLLYSTETLSAKNIIDIGSLNVNGIAFVQVISYNNQYSQKIFLK